ncbi:MAG: CHASE2 domain-containing protein [Rhodomicrobium sp.]
MRARRIPLLVSIAAIVAVIAMQAFAINYLGRNNYLPEGSEHWTEDWLIHYFSKRLDGPHKQVALVFVDAESLEKAGLPSMPPADRAWLAKLITAVAGAGALAIGVDFYFKTPTDPAKDESLVSAIRDARAPVVIAAVDDAFLQTDVQRKFLRDFIQRTGRTAGHIYLKRSQEIFSLGDRATRGVDHGPSAQGYPSLTSAIASLPQVVSALGPREIPDGTQRIDWLLEPKDGETFQRYSAYEILSPPGGAGAPDLKDKIVLIGPDFAGQDQHTVPYSLGEEQATVFPGVFVQAQALVQILDNRFFFNWTSRQQFLLLFGIGLVGATAGWLFHNTRGDIVLGLAGTLLIIAFSVPFFIVRIPLPTALAILAWAVSIWTGQQFRAWQRTGKSIAVEGDRNA